MARQRLSKKVERELEHYYGGRRCIITGNESAEYHHIDDDESNTTFVNLVPITSKFNSPKLRDARKEKKKHKHVILHVELAPENLIEQANMHFRNWEVPCAYGCARLAYFVSMNYLSVDVEFRFKYSLMAMFFARQSCEYNLIRDILKRDFCPIVQSGEVSCGMRAQILQELAGIYSEHGKHKEALDLYQLIPDSAITSEITAEKYSALLRRQAMTIIAKDGLNSRSNALIKEARDTNPHVENLLAGIKNTMAWECISREDYSRAMKILEPFYELYKSKVFTANNNIEPIMANAWNVAEIFHSYCIAAYHLGGKYKKLAHDAMVYAKLIYQKGRARPFVLRPGFRDSEKHIHLIAVKHGIAPIVYRPELPVDIDKLIVRIVDLLIKL